jgi:hypothetical protein
MVYGTLTQAIPQVEQERDPREDGSLCAKLQVAEEIVRKMRIRACFLADRINSMGQAKEAIVPEQHMSLLRFPDEIIADARAIDSALNRIEGALGV